MSEPHNLEKDIAHLQAYLEIEDKMQNYTENVSNNEGDWILEMLEPCNPEHITQQQASLEIEDKTQKHMESVLSEDCNAKSIDDYCQNVEYSDNNDSAQSTLKELELPTKLASNYAAAMTLPPLNTITEDENNTLRLPLYYPPPPPPPSPTLTSLKTPSETNSHQGFGIIDDEQPETAYEITSGDVTESRKGDMGRNSDQNANNNINDSLSVDNSKADVETILDNIDSIEDNANYDIDMDVEKVFDCSEHCNQDVDNENICNMPLKRSIKRKKFVTNFTRFKQTKKAKF